eukprot:XP_001708512.1 Hypothetical protein GL50803_28566 [Giardia lamblia ATCC 50803]
MGDITKMFSSSDKMHLDLLSEDEAADGERKKGERVRKAVSGTSS